MRLCRLKAFCGLPKFDLVLSDIRLPGADGHALARWVARRYPRTRVALMAGSDPGCDECPYPERCARLVKPFRSFVQITEFVERVLAGPGPLP